MAKPTLTEIQLRVLSLSAEQFGVAGERVSPDTRPVEDLGVDSLDLIAWIMAIEKCFDVTLPDPNNASDPVYKEVFTRDNFTLRDMAELVHIRWGSSEHKLSYQSSRVYHSHDRVPFSQLGGKLDRQPKQLYRPLEKSGNGLEQFRRKTDGMVCVMLPAAIVEIGSDSEEAFADEKPVHNAAVDPFLIDRETVSTTAFCRFLNSIDETRDAVLKSWFLRTSAVTSIN